MSNAPSNDATKALLSIPIRGNGSCPPHSACGVCAGCEDRARKMLAAIAVRAEKKRKQGVSPGSESWGRARNKLMYMLSALDLVPESEVSKADRKKIEEWVAYCDHMAALGRKGVTGK